MRSCRQCILAEANGMNSTFSWFHQSHHRDNWHAFCINYINAHAPIETYFSDVICELLSRNVQFLIDRQGSIIASIEAANEPAPVIYGD